jgi:hypothetical protein
MKKLILGLFLILCLASNGYAQEPEIPVPPPGQKILLVSDADFDSIKHFLTPNTFVCFSLPSIPASVIKNSFSTVYNYSFHNFLNSQSKEEFAINQIRKYIEGVCKGVAAKQGEEHGRTEAVRNIENKLKEIEEIKTIPGEVNPKKRRIK